MSDVSIVHQFFNLKVKEIDQARIEGQDIIKIQQIQYKKEWDDLSKFYDKHKKHLEKICPSYANNCSYKNPTGNRCYENFLGTAFDYLAFWSNHDIGLLRDSVDNLRSLYNTIELEYWPHQNITTLQAYAAFSEEVETGPLPLWLIEEETKLSKKRVSESIKELIEDCFWEKSIRKCAGISYIKLEKVNSEN